MFFFYIKVIWSAFFYRAALLQMASALRKQGELGDAHDYCSVSKHTQYIMQTQSCSVAVLSYQEATRLALVSGDQATYARSIRIMGDIYRKKSDINVSNYFNSEARNEFHVLLEV